MHQIIWHGSERSNAYLVFIFLHAQMCSWCTWIIFFSVFAGVLFIIKFLLTGFNFQMVLPVSQRIYAIYSHVKSMQ